MTFKHTGPIFINHALATTNEFQCAMKFHGVKAAIILIHDVQYSMIRFCRDSCWRFPTRILRSHADLR